MGESTFFLDDQPPQSVSKCHQMRNADYIKGVYLLNQLPSDICDNCASGSCEISVEDSGMVSTRLQAGSNQRSIFILNK